VGRNIELAELEFMLNQHKHATVGILAAGRIPKIQKTHTHRGSVEVKSIHAWGGAEVDKNTVG